jgi:hypothetical protein
MAGVEFIKVTPGNVRKVKITAGARVMGQHVDEGQIIEVPESEAFELVIAQKAEFYVEPEPEPETKKSKPGK